MALSLNLHIINVHSFVCDQQQNESYNIFFPKHWYITINKKSDLSWYVNSFEPTCMSWQQQQHKPWRWRTIPIKTSFKFNNFWCRLIITLFRYIFIFNQNSYFVVLLQWLMFLINQNKLTSIMINQHFATVTTAKQEQIFSVSKGKTSSCIRHLPLALPKRLCNTTELKKLKIKSNQTKSESETRISYHSQLAYNWNDTEAEFIQLNLNDWLIEWNYII